ncbi:MAG: hypothetical protein RJB66_1099 [Pseudomonadota bacterium]|jgi:D-glycero-D-manno-heptose 1,7-bisphosphate phosphatase
MKPAAFLDRDGVICEYVDHLHRVEDFKLREKSAEAIRSLNEAGYWVFVMTNQPMIGKGLLTHEGLSIIHARMHSELKLHGAHLDSVEFCPHSPVGTIAPWNVECECRKPKVGMIQKLCREFSIDLHNSFVVGDTWRDIQCAQTMGLFNYGVCGGAGFPYTESSKYASVKPDFMVESLWDAVQHQFGVRNDK